MSKATKPYAEKLNRVLELRANSRTSLWERVKLLVELSEDHDYLQKVGKGPVEIMLFLDQYVDDTNFAFAKLRTAYLYAPGRERWEKGGPISELIDEAIAANAAPDPEEPRQARPAPSARTTRRELEEVARERDRLKYELGRRDVVPVVSYAEVVAERDRLAGRVAELEEEVREGNRIIADLRKKLAQRRKPVHA